VPPLPPLEIIVIIAFAAFRATRLVTSDTITDGLRDRLERWAWDFSGPKPQSRGAWRTWIVEGVTCQWCLGVWMSAAAYCTWRWGGEVALAVLAILAIAGLQGALAQFVVTLHEETED
jgi:hypothetical protein